MSDFGFKRVFANPDYPHILISFIESVLPELSIESIEHIDTTQFADYVDDRTSIFDVFCRLHDGSFVIVEMQQVRQEHYVDRTILYGSHVIQRQSQKGRWNYELPRVYVISLMNFRLFPNDRSLVHTVKLQSDQNPDQPFYDKLNFIYIQQPNITEEFSQNPNLEHWLTMIRNLHTREEPMSIDIRYQVHQSDDRRHDPRRVRKTDTRTENIAHHRHCPICCKTEDDSLYQNRNHILDGAQC